MVPKLLDILIATMTLKTYSYNFISYLFIGHFCFCMEI